MSSFRSLPKSFDAASPGPKALILVTVEWCGYCQQFKPELKNMESKLSARVYNVDGDADPRVADWQVDGYPMILYHASRGGLYKHTGPRTLQGIERFIASAERV